MTKSNDVSSSDDDDFVLKHRITGAAFLIFFGVLFLPWLLSAPSQSGNVKAESIDSGLTNASRADIEQELLAAIENENIVEQDLEIYVSRITPLDAQAAQQKPVTPSSPDKALIKPEVKDNKTAPSTAIVKPAKPIIPEPKKSPKLLAKTDTDTKIIQLNSKPEIKSESNKVLNKVEVGWVVQVGVFTDTKGAEKVVSDLKVKGFKPSTTVVDTNLGKATGTRVWLGPYAQRVDAAKSKTFLKDKTGGDGFIRAYP